MIVKVIHSSYGHETARTLVASIKLDHTTNHQEAIEFAYDRTQNVFDSWSMPDVIGEYDTHQDGGNMVTVEAPHIIFTQIGTQRVLYIHEDTTWCCVYKSDAKTFEEAEADVYTDDYNMLPSERITMEKQKI